MNFKIVKHIAYFIVFFSFMKLDAQPKVYYSEIGVLGGTSFYLGDANNKFLNYAQPSYGLIFRQKFSPRLAAHLNLEYSSIKFVYNTGDIVLEGISDGPMSNQIMTLDLCGEFNFFEYEDKPFKPFSKKYTSFLFAGGSLFDTNPIIPPTLSYGIAFGIGFKAMLGERFNLNILWTNRINMLDKLEGENNIPDIPILNGSNVFNKDYFSTLSLGITYNIFRKECDCKNNSR